MSPQRLLSNHHSRTSVLLVAGRHPLLYHNLFRFSRSYRRENLVRPGTDVCIEGPPGSGNTYAVTGFSMANPNASIGHHHHVRAQLHKARRLGVPAISLLRDPVDCALSRASSWGTPEDSKLVLRQWLEFFADQTLIDYSLLVGFETLTSSSQAVIEEVNQRFGAAFETRIPTRDAVFAEMDKRRKERRGTVSDNPNRPDGRRAKPPASWRRMIEGLPLASAARQRYRALTSSAFSAE